MKSQRIEVEYNEKRILALIDGVAVWEIEWTQIERIGYRTNADGPWLDDHFLVLRTKDNPPRYYDISMDWKGAQELSAHIDLLPDSKRPPQGKLANCANETSVTVWPAEKSGEPL